MKGLIIACLLALVVPLLAAERYEVQIRIPVKQADSLLVGRMEEAVRAADSLVGQIIINNAEVTILGYKTDDTTGVAEKFVKALRKVSPQGEAKVEIKKIKPVEIQEKAP